MHLDLLKANDFKSVLLSEFARRRNRNPLYSQRSFARDLGISSSRLSEILKGKTGLNPKSVATISKALGYCDQNAEILSLIVDSQYARSAMQRRLAKAKLSKFREKEVFAQLDDKDLEALQGWRAFALIEWIGAPSFEPDLPKLAKKFDCTIETMKDLVDSLNRLDLVREDENGRWIVTKNWTEVGGQLPSSAIRKYHSDLIALAARSVECQSVTSRELSSTIIRISRSDLPRAKALIQEFMRSLTLEMGSGGQDDLIYATTLQFFDLFPESNK